MSYALSKYPEGHGCSIERASQYDRAELKAVLADLTLR